MPNALEIAELALNEIDIFLTAEGFKRSGVNFRKRLPNGHVRWSIIFQKNRYNTAIEGSFTFWVHAEWKHRPAWYRDYEPKSTWYGGTGGRIGDLLPGNQDTWWEYNEKTSPQALANEIKEILTAYALPFLRRFESDEDIKKYLRDIADGDMKRNYPHSLTMLNLDILDNKSAAEIEERIKRARYLGKLFGGKELIEEDIQRVLNKKMEER